MDMFLNQAHPFDIAPAEPAQPGQPVQPIPSADTGNGEGTGAGVVGDGSIDDLDDLGGLDDLVNGETADDGDPIEPVNRFIFGFNQVVEDVLFRPLAYTYNALMPAFGRDAVANFLKNLSSPVVLANDLMQGEWQRGWETVQRTAINTTVGVGGLWDAAAWMGIEGHTEDFGQTMAVWGVGEGFYLVLPVLGPSNPRDALGRFGVDPFLDPLGLWLANTDREELLYSRIGVTGLSEYAAIVGDLDNLRETSLDYYAAIRSLYRQKRLADIRNAGASTGAGFDDLDYSLDDLE